MVSCQIKQRAWAWFLPLSVPAEPCACAGSGMQQWPFASCPLISSVQGWRPQWASFPLPLPAGWGGLVVLWDVWHWWISLPGWCSARQWCCCSGSLRAAQLVRAGGWWHQGCALNGPFTYELDSVVLVGPFQLRIFWFSLISVLFRYLPLRAW